ncbi:MAG: Rieske (2Fe-2S) protein [Anaerolineae bacterium]|nr:Rieske (2Fe-2S) protein [Anaerolineae bacterium]
MHAIPSKDKRISRRSFLSWLLKGSLAASGLLGVAALGRFLSFQGQSSQPTEYDLGPALDYPSDSRTAIPEIPAMIIHNQAGFTAISLVCPHLGCTVNVTSEGITCPCHGSRFLADGSLRNGPASKALTSMRAEVDAAGHLIVSTA